MLFVKSDRGCVNVKEMRGDFVTICTDITCVTRCLYDLMRKENEELAQEFRRVMTKMFEDDDTWAFPNDCMEDDDEEE